MTDDTMMTTEADPYAELERLRMLNAAWRRACDGYVVALAARDAEVARLNGTLRDLWDEDRRETAPSP